MPQKEGEGCIYVCTDLGFKTSTDENLAWRPKCWYVLNKNGKCFQAR